MLTKAFLTVVLILAGFGMGVPVGHYWAENPKIEIIVVPQSPIEAVPHANDIFTTPNLTDPSEAQTSDALLF